VDALLESGCPATAAAKKEARRIAAGFVVLNLTLERAGCDYIWW
jgi:hypothetical protein